MIGRMVGSSAASRGTATRRVPTAAPSVQRYRTGYRALAPRVADPGQQWEVWGDRARLGRVFSNLLSNALHHAGQVRVELSAEAKRVCVKVSDHGPGIAPEDLPPLFEKFKGSRTGLGLGLYIVQRILQDHQQQIEVCSQLGQGTTFAFAMARGGKRT